MLNEENEWVSLFKQRGVLKEGHFLLSSGRHAGEYLQCAQLFQRPQDAERVGTAMAHPFQGRKIDVVVGPAVGGIIAAHEVGRALGCRVIFTEREDGEMTLRRGFELAEGERVVVVEDVVTTGGSVNEVLNVIEQFGADVVGITTVVDRSGKDTLFPYPYHPLVRMTIATYGPERCPLCAKGAAPAIKPGSRKS